MKTVKSIRRSLMPLLIAVPVWVSGYTLTKKPKDEACLQLSGTVIRTEGMTSNASRVLLIEENKVRDSLEVAVGETFVFRLQKNKYYSVRIFQEGCMPRLVSISTYHNAAPRDEKLYKFHFDLMQVCSLDGTADNDDVIDFPVAVITFDETKGYFDYNSSYTNRIKDLYRKAQCSSKSYFTAKL